MFSASRTHRAARRFPAANPPGGLDVPDLRAQGRQAVPDAVEPGSSAPGVGPFCSCRADPEKKTPVAGLCWPRAGGRRVRYRPLGGVSAPAARASGTRISQTGGGRFWGQRRIRTRTGKIRQPGFRNSPGVSCIRWGLRNTKIDRPNGRSPIVDLIHRPPAVRSRYGQLHRVSLEVCEALQRYLIARSRPSENRATGPAAGANRVPPALYHVWRYGKAPEDQHQSGPAGGP